jgi:hypothetical protein
VRPEREEGVTVVVRPGDELVVGAERPDGLSVGRTLDEVLVSRRTVLPAGRLERRGAVRGLGLRAAGGARSALGREGTKLGVFPLPDGSAVVVSPERLADDLLQELERYY